MSEAKQAVAEVTSETDETGLSTTTTYHVEIEGYQPVAVGTHESGEMLAKTLASTLNAAGVESFDVLPPGWTGGDRPTMATSNQWQQWSTEHMAVPSQIVEAGKAAVAGHMKVVYRSEPKLIANHLGVSEKTVGQYLIDLREGRR